MKVGVYLDEGVDTPLFRHVVKNVRQTLSNSSVIAIDKRFFLSPNWEEKLDLIVIPGGRDVPYHQNLKGEANRRIRSFVEKGGSYLGICAGAYYGASFVAFDEGNELEVSEERELAFFPGRAVGPAYAEPRFCYQTQKGARIAHLKWKEKDCHIFFNGGCYFDGKHPDVEVLATYADLEDEPSAIVSCKVKLGRAVLCGVHPELDTEATANREPLWHFLLNYFQANGAYDLAT